jgi:DNA-directed RNA polymerase subunit RPC12/RpoP
MKRYCEKCQKEFEFIINSMKDLDNLVCPDCGEKIGRESRRPVDPRIEENEEKIGRLMFAVWGFNYTFYLVFAVIGIIAYFLGFYPLLYVTTFINMSAFFSQLCRRNLIFRTGVFFLPLGAALFYYYFRTPQSICLGLQVVFTIRHLIRDVVYTSLIKLARFGGRF